MKNISRRILGIIIGNIISAAIATMVVILMYFFADTFTLQYWYIILAAVLLVGTITGYGFSDQDKY